jgi:peroxiredoxin
MEQQAIGRALKAAYTQARDSDAPLNERLAIYTRALETYLPEYALAIDQLIGRLVAAGADAGAPQLGETLPPFLLPDKNGRLVSLEGVLREGPAAIVFMRGHWCPYCRMTADALRRVEEKIRPSGRRIIVLTPERQSYARKLAAEAGDSYTILTDSGNGYALSLNLLIWIGDEVSSALSAFGRDLPLYQGDPSWFLPIPATFVVSSTGTITARFIDPDYRRRMEVDDLVSALTSVT